MNDMEAIPPDEGAIPWPWVKHFLRQAWRNGDTGIERRIVKHRDLLAKDPDYRAKWLAAVNETDLNTDTWAKEDE